MFESRHDCCWQRYSNSIQVVVEYDLQFIDIARGFPGIIHDSRVLRYKIYCTSQRANNNEILLEPKVGVNEHQIGSMLLRHGVNAPSKWLLKPHKFSLAISAQENNSTRDFSSTRITV